MANFAQALLAALRVLVVFFAVYAVGVIGGSAAADDFVPDDRYVSDTTTSMADPEFDETENLMVWQDTDKTLWLAKIDPLTGTLTPLDGRGKLLDTGLVSSVISGNGPEWAYGKGQPYVAYTKALAGTMGLAMAKQDADGHWVASLPTAPLNRYRPAGTTVENQDAARIVYNRKISGQDAISWRDLEDSTTEGSVSGFLSQGGRWLAGERSILALKNVNGVQQIFRINIDDAVPTPIQMTYISYGTINPFSWIAPEYNEPLLSAIIGYSARKVGIFRKGQNNAWTLINVLNIPTSYQYVSSPEGFVHNGKSYIMVVAASALGGPNSAFPLQPVGPSEVWIAGIDPNAPFYRRIDDPSTSANRFEPEVFTTAAGPKVFYNETDAATGVRRLRLADTGLGPDWGYDDQSYVGPWAALYRDNKNCSCTPFPVGDGYEDVDPGVALQNTQQMHHIMGPEGNLYIPLTTGTPASENVVAYDTDTAQPAFSVTDAQLSSGISASNGLITANGDVILAANDEIGRFTANGGSAWTAAVRGLTRAPQYLPDGNVLVMTFNGWAQIFDPASGQLLAEQDLTPGRSYAATPECLSTGDTSQCAFIDAAAVDGRRARVFASYATADGNGVVQAYDYDKNTRALTLAWTSQALTGDIGSPVLSADYTRVYVQSGDGTLFALNAVNGETIWTFGLGYPTAGTPVVNENGYIVAAARYGQDPAVNAIGMIEDTGAGARWAFRSTDYVAVSQAAAGRGNRFVQMAQRKSDGAFVLIDFHPYFGIIDATPWTTAPVPSTFSSVTLREDGAVFVGASGPVAYKMFRPIFETAVR